MKKVTALLLVACCLAGCVSAQERAARAEQNRQMQIASDTNACASYGFKPATDAFASCMQQRDLQRKDHEFAKHTLDCQELRNRVANGDMGAGFWLGYNHCN